MEELAEIVLEKGWEHKIKQQILSARQGDAAFLDWKIDLENLNMILAMSAPTLALTKDALKNQLDANLNEDLKDSLANEPVLAITLAAWSVEVKEWNEKLHAEKERMCRMIEASELARTT